MKRYRADSVIDDLGVSSIDNAHGNALQDPVSFSISTFYSIANDP